MISMYMPSVYDADECGTSPAPRTICKSLEQAKAVLDAEVEKAHGKTLDWHDEYGGAVARFGGLVYDIQPVNVDI